MNLERLKQRADALRARIQAQQQSEEYIILTADGEDFPGAEEHNARLRAQVPAGVITIEYVTNWRAGSHESEPDTEEA